MKDYGISHYYTILGVTSKSSKQQIREAYKDLVKVWHPDRFLKDPKLRHKAQEKLKEINDAYQKVLAHGSNGIKETNSSNESNGSRDDASDYSSKSRKGEPENSRQSTNSNEKHARNDSYNYTSDAPNEYATSADDDDDVQTPFSNREEQIRPSKRLLGIAFVLIVLIVLASVLAYNYGSSDGQGRSNTQNSTIEGNASSVFRNSSAEGVTEEHSNQQVVTESAKTDSESGISNDISNDGMNELESFDVQTVQQSNGNTVHLPTIPESSKEETKTNEIATVSGYFSLNSSRDEVLRIQGTPDSIMIWSSKTGHESPFSFS
jgi:curved DNA-binding protein CbpA